MMYMRAKQSNRKTSERIEPTNSLMEENSRFPAQMVSRFEQSKHGTVALETLNQESSAVEPFQEVVEKLSAKSHSSSQSHEVAPPSTSDSSDSFVTLAGSLHTHIVDLSSLEDTEDSHQKTIIIIEDIKDDKVEEKSVADEGRSHLSSFDFLDL